jgi:PAS domain S-box-containing protein
MTAPATPVPQRRDEMAALMESRDWSEGSLGPPAGWPQSLRAAMSICLGSAFPIAIYWGPDLALLYNDAWSPILGQKHPWALGRSAHEVWPEIWETIGPMFERVIATGVATYEEDGLLPMHRHGYMEEAYFNFTFTPIRGESGRVEGIFNAVVETTYRVVSERRTRVLRELSESIANARSLEETCSLATQSLAGALADVPFCAIYLTDPSSSVARLVATTGVEPGGPAAPASLSLTEAAAAPSSPWPLADLWRKPRVLAVTGLGERLAVTLPGGAAPEPATSALVAPILAASGGQPLGFAILGTSPRRAIDDQYRDFAERAASLVAAVLVNVKAYEDARLRADALAAIDRAKTAFFANVSHEFRTPLTLMLGPTEDALSSGERVLRGEQLEMVHRNQLRLMKLVNTLLDFSRAEAGRVHAAYEPTDLASLTTDLASAFRSAMERGGLDFQVDCAPLEGPVYVDREMWEKIVLNLLSNALKFTFEGSVRVVLRDAGDVVVLEVKDSGAGIAQSEQPRIFERFHRIDGTRARTHEGSGIGLALVRDLVGLHGGHIDVASEVGRGTTFTVTLPKGAAHLDAERVQRAPTSSSRERAQSYVAEALRWLPAPGADAASVSATTADGISPSVSSARILVADDNADVRDYIARLLRQHWTVETVADGVEAVEAVHRARPDLVLSDVMMPRLDGFELVRTLRRDATTATIPIMLLSARAGEEAVAEGLRCGADDYLVKPFSSSTLVVRVEALLAAARAREAARRSAEGERERLKAMFAEAPAAICVVRGPDLVIELANPNALEMLGMTNEIVGRRLIDCLPEIRGQGFDDQLRGVLESGVPVHGRSVLVRLDRHRNGDLADVYFDFVFAPLRDPDGTVGGVFIHAFDVTELVNERRAAENANRMKDEFLATMSHELRTPLNAILGWATLLRTGHHTEAAREKALATIERNAKTQARLIDDILDVSRIISGKLRLVVKRHDVAAIVNAAVDIVRPAASAKSIDLVVLVDENAGFISADFDRLQQVVWNLLINAIRFTPPHGKVTVSTERIDGEVVLRVSDTGVGIAPEHRRHVFERFRQVDSSTTRKHGGLGLGLAIVRHLVELHGGTVEAESGGTGKGATFTVRLPVRATAPSDTDDVDRPSSARSGGAAEVGRLDGLHVIVADDDEDSRDLIASALEGAGATVSSVESAHAAFDSLSRSRPSLLISDIGMPEEDGYALIRKVRGLSPERGGDVPAIALTAYARREDERLALDAGYDCHLAKPVDPVRLTDAVERLARPRNAAP